jgi:hypothetical protein
MSQSDPTVQYYDAHADEFAARTLSRKMDEIYPAFLELL